MLSEGNRIHKKKAGGILLMNEENPLRMQIWKFEEKLEEYSVIFVPDRNLALTFPPGLANSPK